MHGRTCKEGASCTFGNRVAKTCLLLGSVVPAWGVLENTLVRHEARLPKLDKTLRVVRWGEARWASDPESERAGPSRKSAS